MPCRYGLFKDLPTGLTDERGRLPDASKYGKLAICEMLKERITKLGKDAVKAQQVKEEAGEEDGGKEFIGNLVDIHKHFVMMFDECCDGDKDLHTVLKQAYARALACSPAPLPSPHRVCLHAKMCGVAAQGG